MNVKFVGLFEIILIVISSFSFAYIVSESNSFNSYLPVDNGESKSVSFIREKVLNFLSSGIVSAQSSGMQTCLTNLNGSSCQEYPASTCNSQCSSACFPGRRVDSPDCRLGTCYDSTRGICNPGTPKAGCENSGGTWSAGTPSACNRHCCLINPDGDGASQARFSTEQQCYNIGQSSGATVIWDTNVNSETECNARVRNLNEGACVLALDELTQKYNCETRTGTSCSVSGGTFYQGKLCTNPELNTKCERTGNTVCYKDRVYFVDNCGNGNRANIYDSTKLNNADYWNVIVPVASSCNLGTSSNFLANQARCGNCDYIAGSTCGTPISGKDTSAISGQYVCRDLSCLKEDGTRVKHRSSWCAFDGAIGVDGADSSNEQRSVDVPGSRHYRKLCFDGEVRNETCAEYRNWICAETDTNVTGVTRALCKENTALSCIAQNEDADKLAKCEENSDCFLKHVEVDKFKFDVCAPKYPAGFELKDLSEESEEDGSEDICKTASQTCTYYEKKNWEGRWSCKINCACNSPNFAETMNNLCMSLGDCGGKVNLAGEYSKNYVVSGDRSPIASQSYIDGLKKYAMPINGRRVELSEEEENLLASMLEKPGRPSNNFFKFMAPYVVVAYAMVLVPGVGQIIAVEIIGAAIAGYILGVGKYRGRQVNFECNPWKPPTGGANCAKCTENGLGCTEYKCLSLGKACKFLNSEDNNPLCVSSSSSDTTALIISLDSSALSSGFTSEPLTSVSGVRIKSSASDGCLKENSVVNFGISLDEPGKCKYSTERVVDYETMEEPFDAEKPEDYSLKHNNTFAMPPLEGNSADPTRRGEYNLYIRCEDGSPNSNSNDEEFTVNFCVMPEDDRTAPTIEEFVPESPGVVGINVDSLDVQFYTNERSTCRYSLQDLNYETMENEAVCMNEINQVTLRGWWLCNARLNVSSISTTGSYSFRCADKPWLGTTVTASSAISLDPERNVNTESTNYTIQKTTTALSITSVRPNGTTISVGSEPVSVNFEISTAGGIDNGKAICRYTLDNLPSSPFFETDSNIHKQTWGTLNAGSHNVDLSCRDRALNRVTGNAQFDIVVDSTGPLITRVYNSGNSLQVVTNERSTCAYSINSCSFDFANGTLLSGLDYYHTMPYSNGLTYKIKCRDSFENVGNCLSVTGGY